MWIAAATGVPVVQTLHDYEFLAADGRDPLGGPLDRSDPMRAARALNTALFQVKTRLHKPKVTRWLAISDFVHHAHRRVGIDAEVLPHFVTPPSGGTRGFDERVGACFVGRLAPEKGIAELLELAALLPEVPFAIAGMGPLEHVVRSAACGTGERALPRKAESARCA